jgi:hypothetical protein
MSACLRTCLPLQAHHAVHPGGVGRSLAASRCDSAVSSLPSVSARCASLTAFTLGGVKSLRKNSRESLRVLGRLSRALAVLDGVEEACARQSECGSVAPGLMVYLVLRGSKDRDGANSESFNVTMGPRRIRTEACTRGGLRPRLSSR